MRRKRRLYPPEVHEYIRKHARGASYRKMAKRLLDKFGLEVTEEQMHAYYSNHHLRNGNPIFGRGHHKKHPKKVTDLILACCEEHMSTNETAEFINTKLGPGTITTGQVRSWMKNHKVRNGYQSVFQKGMTAYNKGKTWDDFMPPESQKRCMKGLHKKGDIPHNLAPIGTVRKTKDGYLKKKVLNYGSQRTRWKFLHRLIWEEHNGPIPKGCLVTFADGDRTNCSIENLVLETKAQHAVKNHLGWKSWDRESAEAYNLMADVRSAVSRKKRREK